MRVVFAGSSGFGIPALEVLEAETDLALVISQPDRPAGRSLKLTPCPVAEYAAQKGLPLFQPEKINDPQSMAKISSLDRICW